MEFPSSGEVINHVGDDLTEDYISRLDNSANHVASGIAGMTVYLSESGRDNVRDAYRIGSLIGLNTRIVDDMLDGDGIEQVDDREEFFNNYISSIETGKTPEVVENESEKAAYRAGVLMGEHLDKDVIADYIRDVRDIAVDEDKSTTEGYSSYSRGISATIGEIVAVGLGELDDFEPDTENMSFAYDFAYLGQVADDMLDDDTGLGDEIDDFYDESVERIKSHGLKGRLIGEAASIYPWVYSGLKNFSAVKANLKSFR